VLEDKLKDVPRVLAAERQELAERIRDLRTRSGDIGAIMAASRELAAMPRDEAAARALWTRQLQEMREREKPLGGIPLHSLPFAGNPDGSPEEQQVYEDSRRNFLALMFCLMAGTAGLPHLLTRYYTAPSVSGARASVGWTLFFIGVLYMSAPALAVLVKFEVMNNLVGIRFDELPNWMAQWSRVDASLLAVEDVNGDGVLQFGEIRMGADLIMLATPELGGMPYVVSGLVAAGGGAVGRLRGLAPLLGHPAHGHGLVLAGRLGLRAGHGAGHLLARHHARRCRGRHAGRPGRHHLLHGLACVRAPARAAASAACQPVVGHTADLGGGLRRAGRAGRDLAGQLPGPAPPGGGTPRGGPAASLKPPGARPLICIRSRSSPGCRGAGFTWFCIEGDGYGWMQCLCFDSNHRRLKEQASPGRAGKPAFGT
jgi:hypothetical protein